MKIKVIWLLLLMAGLTWPATKVEKLVKKVQKKYKSVNVIHLDFKQINRFKLTGLENEIYGSIWLSNDDKFRLETEDQIIVSDGSTYWRYNKLEGQVLIDYAKKSGQDVMFNSFVFNITDDYFAQMLSEQKTDEGTLIELKLTPKNPDDSFFQYLRVWLYEKSLKLNRVKYVDYDENESEYVVEDMELDPKLPAAGFSFTAPDGVEVVDLRF